MPKAVPDFARKGHGFSRSSRLVNKHDFQPVFRAAHKATHKYLLALYLPTQRPYARLGMVISKQHVRLAVERNRLRRIMRESFRHRKETLKGLDIVLLMRSKWAALENDVLRDDLEHLWQKLMLS